MPYDYFTSVGSGSIPHIQHGPVHNVPENTFPVPIARGEDLRTRRGEGAIVLNPEDFSMSVGLRSQAISVGTSAVALPTTPLEFRRALVIHNNGASTIYLGHAGVTTANGLPLLAGEKIAMDVNGTPNITVYAISGGTVEVRILELA